MINEYPVSETLSLESYNDTTSQDDSVETIYIIVLFLQYQGFAEV